MRLQRARGAVRLRTATSESRAYPRVGPIVGHTGAHHPRAPVTSRHTTPVADQKVQPMSEHSSTPTVPATSASDLLEHDLEHEQVVFANDPASGLRAIIAIHSTALGPSLGGTRFHPYASTADALSDVLALSRGMSYKAAVAGLDLGGGKAVIIGNPATQKTEALLRAYGRFVESLDGRYITACDVGTFSEDMDIVARESSHVTGRTEAHGGAGDSSVLTAYGVFCGLRAAAEVGLGRRRSRRGAGRPDRRRRRRGQGRAPPGRPPARRRRRRRDHRRLPRRDRPGARRAPHGAGGGVDRGDWSPPSSTSTPRVRSAER